MKDFIYGFSIPLIVFLFLTPFILKACDKEYEFQQAQVEKWKSESQTK